MARDAALQLVRTIGHELHNGLLPVTGFTELALATDGLDPQVRSDLQRALDSAERVNRFISALRLECNRADEENLPTDELLTRLDDIAKANLAEARVPS